MIARAWGEFQEDPAFMPMYEKPVRVLMRDMIEELGVNRDQVISKDQALRWFADKYPKIKQGTISAHLIRFSTAKPSRSIPASPLFTS